MGKNMCEEHCSKLKGINAIHKNLFTSDLKEIAIKDILGNNGEI